MSRVLVVDDELRYREHIRRALARDGHEVQVAASGREGIAVGARQRPDVLLADWMLKDRIHGLHVSEALQALLPELQTVLVTGYPSADLRSQARALNVSMFIEKPFELGKLRAAVRAVGAAVPARAASSPIAVLVLDQAGALLSANPQAQALLGGDGDGRPTVDLGRQVGLGQIAAAESRWISVAAHRLGGVAWWIRTRRTSEGWLCVVLPDGQQQFLEHPTIALLLDLELPAPVRWPIRGRALIVDSDVWLRQSLAAEVERGGGVCHTAGDLATAMQTFARDPGIDVVVLEYGLSGDNACEFARELRSRRVGVHIVGTSATDRSVPFARAGVISYLAKPWTIHDLAALLEDHLGVCASCGWPLPLRRPRLGETPRTWLCVGCESRYVAVMDDRHPRDVVANVRPADGGRAQAREKPSVVRGTGHERSHPR
ncbi:MAG: response regulator [Phycisphaerae bacterium]|jgi:DNA-binding response OmpR family regulator